MKMSRADLVETFSYLVSTLKERHPELAYLHLTEPRVAGGGDQTPVEGDDLEFLVSLLVPFRRRRTDSAAQHKIWAPKTVIIAGGYTPESAKQEAERRPNVLVGFGRHFISNVSAPAHTLNETRP